MSTDDTPSNRDNLSSVSTILGLALFCLLIATILLRRIMVHRATRRYARQRLLAAANVVGGGGVGGSGVIRRGEDSLDDDEPRTIAIGARAALMKRPILWEQHLSLPCNPTFSEKRMEGAGNSCWDRIQPTALQLVTPHTTAHFPKPPTNRTLPSRSSLDPSPRRISRAYERFLFHRDHSAPAPSVAPIQVHSALSSTANAPSAPNAPPPPPPPPTTSASEPSIIDARRPTSLRSQQRGSTTVNEHDEEQRRPVAAVENQNATEQRNQSAAMEWRNLEEAQPTSPEETAKEKLPEKRPVSEDGVYAHHPVHLTFLISMPDPTTSTKTTATTTSNSNPNWNSPNLPPLTLGTTHPTARLPSILINQHDLDSWWDLPASPNRPNLNLNFGRSPNSIAGRTPTFEFQNINGSRLGHAHVPANANTHSNGGHGHGYGGDGNGNGNGNLSAGQILQLEIERVAVDREREMEQERVMSEGVGGRGSGAARGRSNVYAGYSGLVRAAGVRRM